MPNTTSSTESFAAPLVPFASPNKRGNVRIGLFDSGVGGLSVLHAVAHQLAHADLIYFADQKYCPYGTRPVQEIRARCQTITAFLLDHGCEVIVVACNTASAAALTSLRKTFSDVPIVGMEPAVKPAAQATHSGRVAVLATRGTLQGELFSNTRAEHARTVDVLTVYPSDWVERVERGDLDSPETFESVRQVIEPLLAQGVDEIALGCTHYPFLAPLIERITAGRAALLDPSLAVAKQTARFVGALTPSEGLPPEAVFYTSGPLDEFARVAQILSHSDRAVTYLAAPI